MIHHTPTIKTLNQEYRKSQSQLVVLYGRPGCGKETYIKHFLQAKPHFYYRAREISVSAQKQNFIREIAKKYQKDPDTLTYEACFTVFREGITAKSVIVLDEFDHLIKKGSDFLENLVKLKKKTQDPPVLILLCSSSLVFVEHKMASAMGKLFYEIDFTHKFAELSFLDLVRAFPKSPVRDCLEIYGITGGIPAYLRFWDTKKSVKENICRHILSERGGLFLEAEHYLRTELRELSVYNTILTVLAAGHQKLNELYKSTGFSRAKISVYLKNLMEFEVIEKVVSFDTDRKEHAQKGVYQFKNTFLHFWFRFVFPHLSDLYLLTPEEFYGAHIKEAFGGYMERYFAGICMEYLKLMNRSGRLPTEICKMGTWVGKQGSIDIIAQDEKQECIVGSCSWAKETMEYASFEKLEALAAQAHLNAKYFYFFSGNSFDGALKEKAAKDKRIVLVDLAEF